MQNCGFRRGRGRFRQQLGSLSGSAPRLSANCNQSLEQSGSSSTRSAHTRIRGWIETAEMYVPAIRKRESTWQACDAARPGVCVFFELASLGGGRRRPQTQARLILPMRLPCLYSEMQSWRRPADQPRELIKATRSHRNSAFVCRSRLLYF